MSGARRTEDRIDVILDDAAQLVRTVLRRLGPHAPAWSVLDAHYLHGQSVAGRPPANADDPADPVLVRLCTSRRARLVGGVHLSLLVPHQQAIVATADQVQQLALEAAGGPPLPPCPGHRHPLVAREVDGTASWVCPHDPAHHREAILPPDVSTTTCGRSSRR